LASLQDPKDGPMLQERLKKAEQAVTQARAKLEEAENTKDQTKILQSQIVLTSWLFLSAELCADEMRGPGRYVTTANDRFDEAGQIYKAIEAALKGKADLEQKVCADELVAMHLDAVRVRKDAIEAHMSDSRKAEKARLAALRELAKSYRDCAEKFSLIQTYLLLQEFDKARGANEEVQALLKTIGEKAGELRGLPKDDYYLVGDENTDVDQPVGAEHRIFSQAFAPHAGALSAWLALRGAEATGAIDPALVETALTRAAAALKAAGADESNQLSALYVIGIGNELSGLAEARKDLAGVEARQKADFAFGKAKAAFKKVLEIAGKKGDAAAKSSLAKLQDDVRKRLAELEKSDGFLQRAMENLAHAQPNEAAELLKAGLEFHRDPRLWAARIQARLWARHAPDQVAAELEEAFGKGVFAANDPTPHLLRGQIALALRGKAPEMARAAETHFREALKLGPADDAAWLARVRALLAYAIVTSTSAKEDPTRANIRLDDALILADAARDFLISPVGTKIRDNPKHSDMQAFLSREALALDYQALGFIAAKRLPNYQVTAARSFGEALDEINRLPFGLDQRPFGAPLLDAIRNRPDNASEMALWAEQNKRLALTNVTRGLVAGQLGEAATASKQIALGLERWKDDQQKPEKPTESIEPLLESKTRSELVAFKVLNDLLENKKNPATRGAAADAAVKELEAERKKLEAAGNSESPIAAFVRGLAGEDLVISYGLKAPANHDVLKAKSINAYRETKAILEAPTTRERFPVLARQCNEAIERLEKSDQYLRRGRQARDEYRLSDAEDILRDGLARHPADTAMWTLLVEVRVDRLLGQKVITPEQANEVLAWMVNVPEGFGRYYGEGLIHEQLKDWAKAVTAFEKAEQAAVADKNDSARVRAASKLISARIRLGIVSE
jgi:hypothetical protein